MKSDIELSIFKPFTFIANGDTGISIWEEQKEWKKKYQGAKVCKVVHKVDKNVPFCCNCHIWSCKLGQEETFLGEMPLAP